MDTCLADNSNLKKKKNHPWSMQDTVSSCSDPRLADSCSTQPERSHPKKEERNRKILSNVQAFCCKWRVYLLRGALDLYLYISRSCFCVRPNSRPVS